MSGRLGRTLWAGVTIGVAFLLANLILSIVNTRQLREESISILHSNELLLALDNVLSLVTDAETGQRGFVITGKPEYLAPYKTAVGSIQRQMDALQALTAADPAQQVLMADVRRHIGTKLGELDLTIGLRERKGFDLAKEVIALGAGKEEMDALRATVASMARHETKLLLEREASARKTYRSALVTELVSGLAAIAALLGFSRLLVRYLVSRDRNEALITSQREQLRTTLASIGDAVITTDADAKVTDLNRAAETLTGWSRADAEGLPLGDVFRIVDEATRQPVAIPAERALREGVIVGLANPTILIRKDGSEAPIDDSAAPIRDAAGHLLGCVLVFRDITERKANERALRDARSRLERVVTDMAIPTMVYAEDGEVLIVNRAWTGITGYAATELATLSDWTSKAYGRRALMMDQVVGSLFELDHSVDNGEREITTASGEKRVWHFITAPLGRDERGRRTLVTNAIDVTERGRLDRLLVESEARLRLAMEAANYLSRPTAATRRLRILIVDDNHDSADSLATLLSLAGHEAHVAHDGLQALERGETLRPGVVLLDIGLPDLDGYEVCKRLRALPWASSIPIIALTGWGQDDDRQRSREAGFDGHLVKPVVLDELVTLLGEYALR